MILSNFFFSLEGFSSPATIPLPFDEFRPRGGGAGQTDFTAVQWILLEVIGNGNINGLPEHGWSIEIDRIRVGRIPEPATIGLFTLAATFITYRCFRDFCH